jgi:four helix bundle protein
LIGNCRTAELPNWRILEVPNSKSGQLKARTKAFAVRVVRLFQALPGRPDAQVLGRQALRSGTSVAANYRAACRARSRPEFVAKIGIVAEEADETVLWLELLGEVGIVPASRLDPLIKEARELTAIFTASQNTARRKN